MPSERIQRQIDALLDEADAALKQRDWGVVKERAEAAQLLDPENWDAQEYLAAAQRALGISVSGNATNAATSPSLLRGPPHATPISFANGRYQVRELLGEGGKKRVYRAHDTLLDREVALALIKTEGLDEAGRERVRREARAMGRLGSHPNIVAVLDLGEEQGQPYLVTELMPRGDFTELLQNAPDHRLPIPQVLELGQELCRALQHAHARDIVHRDLKPGNIWLSQEGVAKLGDFGLAVALDQTRHTQPGTMIGTVSYMAPEQAIGGQVDARSDLYALGCVLYELVCGRPPFVGDESVAILTQHLNTPPVAPTWHRPDCPPGLDSLVLRLLEKEPGKRPESATEVVAALAAINVSDPGAAIDQPHNEAFDSVNTPLYQQTFVGREAELRQLQAAYEASLSGRGGLVMVVGEPGIGKTALCEQLATYAAVRGGATLVGHSYEEGSLRLPYLAFVEALRSYVLSREPETLQDALGSGAGDVARIISEVRERVAIEPRPSGGDPEEDRWRLLEAVTGFLKNAATIQPLVIVLEDLHWADRGTLDLLQHVARNLTGARLLIVGTYRDVEVDRSHPLSSALADLRRSSAFVRIGLRGLSVDEVHRMMQQLRGQDIPWSRAEAIHRQTEGNPLFVQEVLRYIVEAGILVREGGRWVRADDGSPESGIPEGLRDVIGKRLSRLSDATNQVLGVAAVIGREFRLDVLQRVASLTDEAMDLALAQAQERAIVEQRSTMGALVFRFTHAFFRQTLYEEIFASRRLRLHQQVARALEGVYGRRVNDHASELAEHFAQSTDPADLGKALHYSELAAQRSMQVFAYSEAARQLDQALKVQEVLDPDDAVKRCDLLLALAEALLPTEEPGRVARMVAPEAFSLAEKIVDDARAARVAVLALEALVRAQGGRLDRGPEYQEWADRADRHAVAGSIVRVYADVYMGVGRLTTNRSEAHGYFRRGVALAQDLTDPRAFFAAASSTLRYLNALHDRGMLHALATDVLRRPREGARSADLAMSLGATAQVSLEVGDRTGANKACQDLTELAGRTRDAAISLWSDETGMILAFVDGRLEDSVAVGFGLRAQADTVSPLGGSLFSFGRALLYQGRTAELESMFDLWSRGRPPRAGLACWLAHLGRGEESRRIREEFEGIGSEDDESALEILVYLLEAALLTRDRAMAGVLARRLAPFAGFPCARNAYVGIARLLGGAAELLGEPQQARHYYRRAIDACEKIHFRPELALTRLELAELLLDEAVGGEASAPRTEGGNRLPTTEELRAEALPHLDFAISELRDMKMQPALERALRRKLQLQGVESVRPSTSIDAVHLAVAAEQPDLRPHAAPDGTVTLLFTDIEDSTGLTVRLGDQRWLEILRAHHALVRQQVQMHGAFEVKCQGDGFMLAFSSARRALDCAVAIQRAVESGNRSHPDAPIHVRIGLHTGEALKEADDFHGKHVVLAARIANHAQGGEILVSSLLRELTDTGTGISFDAGEDVDLKGLIGAQRVFRVLRG